MTVYGYARVSTAHQDTHLQIDALQRAGASTIVQEKTSSVGARRELNRLLSQLKRGDCVLVYKLDRFARSLIDLLKIIDRIESVGASFRSITESIDTATPAGRMMMQMLGAFAEFERGMIRERSIAGQNAARERGNLPGRPRALTLDQERELVVLYQSGFYTQKGLATRYDVSVSVVKRALYRVTRPTSSSLK
ncbi:MAG: recombinase family protein [Giesbergeria sp.]|uniref:recombinase family protein n=1 Tax=Giesbergeria sp. TaxID=2818473 RepID=UPI0026363955|nr:recombinase family protein [Giesbergeria sp.]MDD2609643.1 recombinase family protein [Giesbergeria sp.]